MKNRPNAIALALCCLLAAAQPFRAGAAGGDEKGREKEKVTLLAVGERAPDWTLRDAQGRAHTLLEYRGKVVVLDFWATWCGPCSRVMPRMEKLHRKYGGQRVVVFGVDSWDTGDPVAAMSRKRYTYNLLLKGEEMAPAYGVVSLPVVYVIGTDGRVIYSHAGPEHKSLEGLIDRHLAASPAG